MTIPIEGFVDRLTPEIYHSHKALSAGGAIKIMRRCPAVYHHTSPWGPAKNHATEMDFVIGTAVHLAVLEPDEFSARTVALPAEFADFRKAEAKVRRDAALAAGKIPLLAKHVFKVAAMHESVMGNPVAKRLLRNTSKERSYFWNDQRTQLPCKMRVDAMPDDGSYILDIKTCESAHPRAIQRTAVGLDWPMRAAWYIDGLESVAGCPPDEYWFLAVETEPPHVVKVYRLSDRAVQWGRILNGKAVATVAECLAADEWPDYGPDPGLIDLPGWEEAYLEEQHAAGRFETPPSEPPQTSAKYPKLFGQNPFM